MFGDPHYKTFDGLFYTFKGLGKYQLVSDCHKHSFSVRVVNSYQTRNKTSVQTKRIWIKAYGMRVILGQKLKVTVNGKKIDLPLHKNKLNVTKQEEMLSVMFDEVKVLWNGKTFLEVTVSSKYRKKLCGLCGNFNGAIQDDLKMRKASVVNVSRIGKFGTSWCVGRKCELKGHAPVRTCTRNKKMHERKTCDFLNNEDVFGECNGVLSYKKYLKACKMDMCDCPSGK